MELHDLYLACEKYMNLSKAIHEGYHPDKDEIDYMNLHETEYGLAETPYDINQEEVCDADTEFE